MSRASIQKKFGRPHNFMRSLNLCDERRREQGGCLQQDGHGQVGLGGGDRPYAIAQLYAVHATSIELTPWDQQTTESLKVTQKLGTIWMISSRNWVPRICFSVSQLRSTQRKLAQ